MLNALEARGPQTVQSTPTAGAARPVAPVQAPQAETTASGGATNSPGSSAVALDISAEAQRLATDAGSGPRATAPAAGSQPTAAAAAPEQPAVAPAQQQPAPGQPSAQTPSAQAPPAEQAAAAAPAAVQTAPAAEAQPAGAQPSLVAAEEVAEGVAPGQQAQTSQPPEAPREASARATTREAAPQVGQADVPLPGSGDNATLAVDDSPTGTNVSNPVTGAEQPLAAASFATVFGESSVVSSSEGAVDVIPAGGPEGEVVVQAPELNQQDPPAVTQSPVGRDQSIPDGLEDRLSFDADEAGRVVTPEEATSTPADTADSLGTTVEQGVPS